MQGNGRSQGSQRREAIFPDEEHHKSACFSPSQTSPLTPQDTALCTALAIFGNVEMRGDAASLAKALQRHGAHDQCTGLRLHYL